MLELWIDGCKCDFEDTPALPIGIDIDKLGNAEGYRESRSITLTLAATPTNDVVFGSSCDIYATSRFNASPHLATLKKGGVVIFEGSAHLLSTHAESGFNGYYSIRIDEGGAKWIESVASGVLSELDIEFDKNLTLSTISNSWSDEQSVRFLPISRPKEEGGYSSSTLPIERVMLTDDYHPFISISDMVRAMFANTGYTLHSNFLDSEFGKSLYMSGDYTRSNASAAKEKCDFFARRSSPTTATADFFGRVYASTSFAAHTVGAIVDTANPEAFDSNGVQMVETFNTLNAFSLNSAGNICFTPQRSVKAGFVLHLEYTTDYKILSRHRLTGFDIVEGLDNARVEFPLVNTYKDCRSELSPNFEYRAIVFNHTKDREYRLLAKTSNGTFYSMGEWSARSALVATTLTTNSAILYYRDSPDDQWWIYADDWALYNGYIEEEGTVDVKMDFRIPPQEVAAGGEFLLDKIWFGGAEAGMHITIGTGTTLRPYFTTVPGYGSLLHFPDIAPRKVRQIALLAAIGEMFNLVFYTDEVRKEVHIEPLEEFYDKTEVLDWSGRIDHSKGIRIADVGLEAPRKLLFGYIEEDRASHSFNLANDTILGYWEFSNPLYGANKEVLKLGNNLFTTTVNTTDVVGCAPSASLMQVGDVGDEQEGIDIGFTPHIVCYKGLRSLPDGECWVAGERLDHYPYAAFLDDESINLGFEDRGGMEGLNRYYQKQLARTSNSQRITLDLHLTTAEIATLSTADGPKPSLRKKFRFNINGESAIFRLVKVESWDTKSNVLRCLFERELNN